MSLKKLVESINELVASEEEITDVQDTVDIDDATLDDPVGLVDYSTTDKLDAKTKISRAFDVLKKAFDDFQTDIVEDIEISSDSEILNSIQDLEVAFTNVENAIAATPQPEPVTSDVEEVEVEEETDEDDELEPDFDAEATIDFSNVEEENAEEA